jgi:hypothetical protein
MRNFPVGYRCRIGIGRALFAAAWIVTLTMGCWFHAGPGGIGIGIAPALPGVVEMGEDDPYFYQNGYYYAYRGDRWSYASRNEGPWSELPRDRYPREVRYRSRRVRPR